MNDPRPGERDERDELHDERLSELYRATHEVEPPVWLDQRILMAARTAVEKPRPPPAIRWFRWRSLQFWTAPVALAATVVLAVGLLCWLPPASELGGMPAAVEEKAAPSLARPAAESDAAPARDAESAVAPPAAPSPAALPPEKLDEQQRTRSRTMPKEAVRSESFQAAPARRLSDGEAAPVQEWADRRPPAAWRAEIAELRRQGRNAEAEARLAEFRRQYPDESLNDAEPPR